MSVCGERILRKCRERQNGRIGYGCNLCPSCIKQLEDKFVEIKEYIRDNKVASISEISDKFEVSTKQIEQWVREERLCFADDSPIGLQCECCGATIKTGRYCDKCKGTMANKLDNLYKAPAAAPRTGRDRDNARMRFLDK